LNLLSTFAQTTKMMIRKILFFLYLLLITLLSLIPSNDLPRVVLFPHADKLIHMTMYAGFTFLLFLGWPNMDIPKRRWIPLLSIFLWGLTMEVLQGLGPWGRSFDLFDELANVFGFFPGYISYYLFKRWFPKLVRI